MAETEAEDKPYVSRTQQRKIDLQNHIGRGAGFAVLVLAVAFVVWFACNVPGHPWRQNDTKLPWRGNGVTVEEAQAKWNLAAGGGEERLENRALLYPTMHIKLGNFTGSGYLHVVFRDQAGNKVGDTCRLPYKDGQFIDTAELTIKASGKEADCYIETGFTRSEGRYSPYVLHKMNVDEPLWRVEVLNEPEGRYESEMLGHKSIPADDFPGL